MEGNKNFLSLNYKIQLTLVLCIGSILMLFCFFKDPIMNKDGTYYLEMAKHLFKDTWGTTFYARDIPFVPFLIHFFNIFIDDYVLSGQIISMVSFFLTLVLFYFLAREIFGEKIGFISSLFMALSPTFQLTSSYISRDHIFVFFMMSFFCNFYWSKKKGKIRYHVGSFLSLILALLCRLEGLVMLIVYLLCLVYKGMQSSNFHKKWISIIFLFCMIIFGIIEVFTPYSQLIKVNRFYHITSAIRETKTYYSDLTFHKILTKLSQEEKKFRGADLNANLLKITQNYFLLIYFIGLIDTWVDCAFAVMFFLGFIGLYRQICYEKDQHTASLVSWMLLLLSLPYLFLVRENYLSTRYLMPASVLLYLWSGPGFFFLWDKLQIQLEKKRIAPKKYKYIFCILLLFLLSIPFFKIVLRNSDQSNLKEAGNWAQKNIPGKIFITNDSRLLFYAGLSSKVYTSPAVLKDALPNQWLEIAKEIHAEWIILKEDAVYPELGKLMKIFPGKKKNIYVYKVSPGEKE